MATATIPPAVGLSWLRTGPAGKLSKLLLQKVHRFFRFEPSDQRPAVHVAGSRHNRRDMAHAEDAERVVAPHVTADAASAGSGADEAKLSVPLPAATAPVFSSLAMTEAVDQRRSTALARSLRAAARRRSSSSSWSLPRSKPTPPGRSKPAAEAAAAQDGGHVQEISPDAAAE